MIFREENTIRILPRQKILYIGHLGRGSNALSLLVGFETSTQSVVAIDTKFFDTPPKFSSRRVVRRLFPHLYAKIASAINHQRIMRVVNRNLFEIIFVYKGIYVQAKTLETLEGVKAHFHPDDSSQIINVTEIFKKAENLYGVHFTTRDVNVDEIVGRTRADVHKLRFAFDERWHFKMPTPSGVEKFQKIGFIGHFRPDRADLILDVAKRYGKDFIISGLNWEKVPNLKNLASLIPPVYEERYAYLIRDVPLQLGLLNSDNRDEHTCRTFEIPASGGLIIAVDTPEHRKIFLSENNALFFSTLDELFLKIDWARMNPLLCKKIAANSNILITKGNNTWFDRANQILQILDTN